VKGQVAVLARHLVCLDLEQIITKAQELKKSSTWYLTIR